MRISTISKINFLASSLPVIICVSTIQLKAQTCTPPSITNVTPGFRCGTGTVQLNATTSSGTISWYTDSVGGSPLDTGSSFITPSLNPPGQIYYAEPREVTNGSHAIGIQTIVTLTTSGPYSSVGNGRTTRHQYLFLATELTTAGFLAGNFTSITFNVTTVGNQVYGNYTIGMANTSSSVLTSSANAASLTTVYTAANYTPVIGNNLYTFSAPFNWDGISNVLVNVCHSDGGTGTTGSTVAANSAGFNANSVFANQGGCGTTLGTLSTTRPYVILEGPMLCIGKRVADTAYVFAQPLTPIVSHAGGDTLISSKANSYQWYVGGNPIAGATDSFYVATQDGSYSVMITDSNGCTAQSSTVVYTALKGIKDGDGILIYPNPAWDQFMIYVPHVRDRFMNGENAIIGIYNLVGEKVFQSEITPARAGHTSEIEVSGLRKGIYVIELINGEKIYRAKFVKE